MAPYCVPSDVRTLISTEKKDLEVAGIITDADRDLDDRLIGKTMSEDVKRLCSMRLAAVQIAQSQRGILSDSQTDNKSTTEWIRYVEEKVAAAKYGAHKTPKIYSTRSLREEDYELVNRRCWR